MHLLSPLETCRPWLEDHFISLIGEVTDSNAGIDVTQKERLGPSLAVR